MADRDGKLMFQDRENAATPLKVYQAKDLANQQKARADRANAQIKPPAMGEDGKPAGQHSWVGFLEGMAKNPWAAHKAYVAPTAAQQQVPDAMVPQGLQQLNQQLVQEKQAVQQQRMANAEAGYAPVTLAAQQNATGTSQMQQYTPRANAPLYNLDPVVLMQAQKQAEDDAAKASVVPVPIGRSQAPAQVSPAFQVKRPYDNGQKW